jgi:hypothetical protein
LSRIRVFAFFAGELPYFKSSELAGFSGAIPQLEQQQVRPRLQRRGCRRQYVPGHGRDDILSI